jgi:hypothetical protein
MGSPWLYAALQAFASHLLSCCHLEGLIIGNITASEAETLARSLRSTLSQQGRTADATNGTSSSRDCKLLAAGDRLQEQCVVLPGGVALLHKAAARNPEEENCCVEAYYQVCVMQLQSCLIVHSPVHTNPHPARVYICAALYLAVLLAICQVSCKLVAFTHGLTLCISAS